MADRFIFAPNTHVAEEIAPDEPNIITFNGWDFASKPAVPYRAKFRLVVGGLYWRMAGERLDLETDPATNAGSLLEFYKKHRRFGTFVYEHEYLGPITCRFDQPVNIPMAMPNASGLVPPFEVVLIHHNPGF